MLKKSWTVFLKPASGQYGAHPFHISPTDHGQYRVTACDWQGTSDPGFILPGTLIAPKRRHTRKEVEVLIEFYFCATAASYTKKGQDRADK